MLTSLYNYIFGYVYVKCENCNRELCVKSNIITEGSHISCSNGCTFELYNKLEKKDNKKR